MIVSKNFSVSIESLNQIEKLIKRGEFKNASELVQYAINEYLDQRED